MRSKVNKIDILSRVYKLKTALYNGKHYEKSVEWHNGAHESLNKILNMLDEYRE